MLQLLGEAYGPQPPAGALPLEPTGGLCPPDRLTHFAVPPPHIFPKFTPMATVHFFYCINIHAILHEEDRELFVRIRIRIRSHSGAYLEGGQTGGKIIKLLPPDVIF